MGYGEPVSCLCLDRRLLGTDRHLVVDEGTFAWATAVPAGALHLSGEVKVDTERCFDTALRLGSVAVDLSPPEAFVKAMSALSGSLGEASVPWALAMPDWAHRAFVKRLAGDAVVAMAQAPLNYYTTTWVTGNGIFRALQPCAVHAPTWHALVVAGEGNVPAINSFEPGPNGLAAAVDYDRFKTLTGRLTVRSGPQILTLKREHRGMIRSVYGEAGTVVALDFAALEARVLLYEYGRKCDHVDLYGMIAKELGHDRQAIKAAVICELYGSSKKALGVHLGISGKKLDTFVSNVRGYFRTADLLARVKQQFVATGKVIDRYGRPVTIDEPLDHVMINYYAQATGVDVTMLGFRQVVDTLAKKAPRVRPIFLLHDAILLDVPNDDLPTVQAIKSVRVPGYVQRFPLKLERVS